MLNGRNFTQLAALSPGVSNQTGQDEGTVGVYGNADFSFNGGRTSTTTGKWTAAITWTMEQHTLNVYPSIDAIAEVKVLTSNYGAQYGRSGSAPWKWKRGREPTGFTGMSTISVAMMFSCAQFL